MTIQEAVKKAIDQGYKPPEPCEIEGIKVYHKGDTFLDPLFWQALVRAILKEKGKELNEEIDNIVAYAKYQQFMDENWKGKTPETFFESLT